MLQISVDSVTLCKTKSNVKTFFEITLFEHNNGRNERSSTKNESIAALFVCNASVTSPRLPVM